MIQLLPNFNTAIKRAATCLHNYGRPVHTEMWHGRDISQSPQHEMHELLNFSFSVPVTLQTYPEDLRPLQDDINPNLPWAEDHFEERVGGVPLNPGEQYKNWPYYVRQSENDSHRVVDEKFHHTYMERFWPDTGMQGIRYPYGDLDDVVKKLYEEPFTRQAFLPVWFPEDTGKSFRVPCTLGYHFIMRGGYFHCIYYIRSCDFFRHFRDDIYLAVRLQLWILHQLRTREEENPGLTIGRFDWRQAIPGTFTMHITSLHCFKSEVGILLRQ